MAAPTAAQAAVAAVGLDLSASAAQAAGSLLQQLASELRSSGTAVHWPGGGPAVLLLRCGCCVAALWLRCSCRSACCSSWFKGRPWKAICPAAALTPPPAGRAAAIQIHAAKASRIEQPMHACMQLVPMLTSLLVSMLQSYRVPLAAQRCCSCSSCCSAGRRQQQQQQDTTARTVASPVAGGYGSHVSYWRTCAGRSCTPATGQTWL
jgi:hypothetical protein